MLLKKEVVNFDQFVNCEIISFLLFFLLLLLDYELHVFNIRCNLIRNKVLFISEWSSKDQSYEAKAVNNILLFLCNRMALDYIVR